MLRRSLATSCLATSCLATNQRPGTRISAPQNMLRTARLPPNPASLPFYLGGLRTGISSEAVAFLVPMARFLPIDLVSQGAGMVARGC